MFSHKIVPETTTGGNALKFYASVRIDIRKVDSIMKGDEQVGNHVRAKIIKNKVAPPFKKAEFDIMFEGGFDRPGQIIDVCVEQGIIKKSGTWFAYGDNRLGQGKENVKTTLKENQALYKEVEAKAIAALGKKPDPTITAALAEEAKAAKKAAKSGAAPTTEEVA